MKANLNEIFLVANFKHRINFQDADVHAEIKFEREKGLVTEIISVGISQRGSWILRLHSKRCCENTVKDSFPTFILDAIPGLGEAIRNQNWPQVCGKKLNRISQLSSLGFINTERGYHYLLTDFTITDYVVAMMDDRNWQFLISTFTNHLSAVEKTSLQN